MVEGLAVTIPVLANDTDPDGNTMTVTNITSPPTKGTATINAGTTVTYTSTVDVFWVDTDTFTYEISDGNGGTATATVTVTILPAIERITQGTADSFNPAIDNDGGIVAFVSLANLVAPDNNLSGINGIRDIYAYNRLTSSTELVSISPDGSAAGNDNSFNWKNASVNGYDPNATLRISADGQFVVFDSRANNLLAPQADNNGRGDIFVRNRTAATTDRWSVTSGGAESTGGPAGVGSNLPAISADGQTVVFRSQATNLVAGDTNKRYDTFTHKTGLTQRIDLGPGGQTTSGASRESSISGDGRFVVYNSTSTPSQLVAGVPVPVPPLAPGEVAPLRQVYLYDSQTGVTQMISRVPNGDMGNGRSFDAVISADGNWVAFASYATNLDLVLPDTNGLPDLFLYDRVNNTLERISLTSDGGEDNGFSGLSSISADGRFVAFASTATNLLATGDSNGALRDIFVWDRTTHQIKLVSVNAGNVQADNESGYPVISGDGQFVAFDSIATNLVTGDTNGVRDIFVAPNPFLLP